jgi:hypothetical protein
MRYFSISPNNSNRVFLWAVALCAVLVNNAPHLFIKQSPLPNDVIATGFNSMDELFYASCSRRVVEDGAWGLFYANPYAFAPHAPRAYSQLYFVLSGWIWRVTGLSFPTVETLNRLFFGVLFLGLAGECFLWRFGRWRYFKSAIVLLFFFGGGAWFLASVYTLGVWAGPFAGSEDFSCWTLKDWAWGWREQFSYFESLYCTWGMNLFRRLSAGYQVFYHTLFYAGWLSLLKGRWKSAFLFSFLLWWAHPFSALDFAVPFLLFAVVSFWLERDTPRRIRLARVGASFGLLMAGLFYYLVFLAWANPQHAVTQRQMQSIGHILHFWRLVPALGALFFVPFFLHSRPPRWRSRSVVASLCLIAGVFGLTFHHWVTGWFGVTFQPIHFEQGYLFFGLLFLACEMLAARDESQETVGDATCDESTEPAHSQSSESPASTAPNVGIRLSRHGRWRRWFFVAACLSLLPDNPMFYFTYVVPTARTPGVVLTRSEKDLLDYLAKLPGPRLILFLQESLSTSCISLVPVETPHRVLGGHICNTPDIAARTEQMKRFVRTADLDIWASDAPDTLVVPVSVKKDFEKRFLPREAYRAIHENKGFVVYDIVRKWKNRGTE